MRLRLVTVLCVLTALSACGDDEKPSGSAGAGGSGAVGVGGSGTGGAPSSGGTAGTAGTGGAQGTPYGGTPAAVPGTIEAEDFDEGGEGIAYHDNVPGNAGGEYRLSEDVDIKPSTDAAGGDFVVTNFETGEWMNYTIQVGATGLYDIELRASTSFADSAFRIEIDGTDVTGPVEVPSTGGWSTFQWVGKKSVSLSAGVHVLRVVAVNQYFDLNSIRVLQSPPATGATLLFDSGFEGNITLSPFVTYGNGGWQDISGTDTETGFSWPPSIWGGSGRFQFIADEPVTATTLPDNKVNEIKTVTGPSGSSTRALYMALLQSVGGATTNNGSTQNVFHVLPGDDPQGDLYVSYWLKLQPDLLERMTVSNWSTRVVTDWKTQGDYRVILSITGDGANDTLYWNLRGDNVANGGLPEEIFWNETNTSIPVPVGQWFRVEIFVHRSNGADGRVWIAVGGQTLFDHHGPNMGINNLPWNRVMTFLNYSQAQLLPAYQWMDDLEIWDGFPATASSH